MADVTRGPKPESGMRALIAMVKGPAIVLGLVLASRTVLAQPFYVPSGSMEPTLQIGDELMVAKYAYGYSRYSLPIDLNISSEHRLLESLPQYGDVVVFRLPRDPDQVYVKRAIGLPGDRIQMRAGRLWINSTMLKLREDGTGTVESEDGNEVTAPRFVETLPNGREHPIFKLDAVGSLDDTRVFVVPAGHVFMMGDNRDNSLDSRVAATAGGVGFVPVENLIGRAEVVLGSWDLPMARLPITQWPSGLRVSRFFSRIH
ncbi:signal peptidase I Serine peptidase. MEROPS family S26A [Rhizobiales bacterium GAS191]|jgi:signal peptidase I|nr:signal peptidase I Serine peptidase. MEROPS family S26A [Rhizobiales bacterium GAS113]SEC47171.1 signal peptidase I Serine peptidase. MEROPS family S26A [Rhizobiales bacterium GAS191]SEC79157.1 signal peptidase I Serine peptidase. MEROPS family S26A [Rhizobiales bacterium GAS188]